MELKQAKVQTVSENPFYGLKHLLTLQKYYEKVTDVNTNLSGVSALLNAAWQEASNLKDIKYKQLFFMIIFSGGDIANREHNMFGKIKVDQGGQSKRKAFRLSLEWILNNQNEYFYKFLPLIAEYTNYENLFFNQIRTDRRKGILLSTEMLGIDQTKVAEFLSAKINDASTTQFELDCIAKFLPKVPQSKRWRKDKEGKSVSREKKQHTLKKDFRTVQFITALTKAMGWEIQTHKRNTRFKGYETFRSKHLKLTEAHLFSSKKIMEFDKVQFLTWLETLPAGARYRVQTRIIDKVDEKLISSKRWKNKQGEDLGGWYLDWMNAKQEAMKKLISLTDEDKGKMSKDELKDLVKQSKLTTGGNTIYDAFIDLYKSSRGEICSSKPSADTDVLLQTLIDKVKMDVPLMVCIDVSGSMGGTVTASGGTQVSRLDVAKLMASVALYKNPNPDLANTVIAFDGETTIFTDGIPFTRWSGRNRFVRSDSISETIDKICDRTKPFTDTLRTVSSLFTSGGVTNFSSVADYLKKWTEEDPSDKARRVEIIASYPVWLMISDGDLNSAGTPGGSMDQFKHKMLQYFGASPVIVVWDILDERSVSNTNYFENIENVVHLAGVNPGIINQLFCNIDDLHVIDIYLQLDTLFRSSRYQPVKHAVGEA